MSEQLVLYEKEGNIARITLNKPEKLNAMDFPGQGGLCDAFYKILDEVAEDDDVKVVIIRGSGRAFSSGHDLTTVGFIYGMGKGQKEDRRASERMRLKVDRNWLEKTQRLFLFPKVTIAQVHGYCIGEGMVLATCCDLAVVAEDAVLGHTEQRLGFAGSGIPTIPHLILTVGLKKAMELLLTGDRISGEEAARMGLVNKAVPVDALEKEVTTLAEKICLMPRDGIAIGKATRHMLYDSLGLNLGFSVGYNSHSFFTNIRWEEDEYSFFKKRRDEGTKAAFHQRDTRYTDKDGEV